MLDKINEIVAVIDEFVWGIPLIVFILAVGIYLTFGMKFMQIRFLPRALKLLFAKDEGEGEVSSFGALCTSLSATIGTGNIVGVATAIGVLSGGPGALFWMWVAAFFGMATKYAEGFLAIKYRKIDENGHVLGGPFYYIEKGMGSKWKWLAKMFAAFGAMCGLLGIGTFSQVSGISTAVNSMITGDNIPVVHIFGGEYSIVTVITSVVLAVCVALVVIGGIQRISSVSQVVVPTMAIVYVVAAVSVLVLNWQLIPAAFGEIFAGAFGIRSLAGGALATVLISVQKGVARGIFSNEAGLGSAPIAIAASKSNDPVKQGLITMTSNLFDTLIICTMTGLVIITMGSWENAALEGAAVSVDAFQKGLCFLPGQVPSAIITICLVFFAFTTIIGWNYYGERCLEYLAAGNKKTVMIYRVLYVVAVFIGPYMTVTVVWNIADIFNGLMAFPNLIALVGLSRVVFKETNEVLYNKKK